MAGSSLRQGPHHEAQKLRTTGVPLYVARSNGSPVSVVPTIAGAGPASNFGIRLSSVGAATVSDCCVIP